MTEATVCIEPVLCYVNGSWAYFTTRSIDKQWGDDWNDAPYEHNAGTPYSPHGHDTETWEIYKVAWEGPYDTPADVAGANSSYSVEQINRGDVAWLAPCRWTRHPEAVPIYAGETISAFRDKITQAGGLVYEPR